MKLRRSGPLIRRCVKLQPLQPERAKRIVVDISQSPNFLISAITITLLPGSRSAFTRRVNRQLEASSSTPRRAGPRRSWPFSPSWASVANRTRTRRRKRASVSRLSSKTTCDDRRNTFERGSEVHNVFVEYGSC